jgi:hypothetical protein
MLEETLYRSTLFLSPVEWPKYAAIIAAGLPGLVLGAAFAKRGMGLVAGILWGVAHSALFIGLLKLTSGKYAYSLFTWCSPLADLGHTAIVSTALTDRLLTYVLPAAVHGVVAAIVGLIAWSALGPRRSAPRRTRRAAPAQRRTTKRRS